MNFIRSLFESDKARSERVAREFALRQIGAKRLWRVCAIEMMQTSGGGWKMGQQDHFTVEAPSEELAVGVFKLKADHMSWFVTAVTPETVAS